MTAAHPDFAKVEFYDANPAVQGDYWWMPEKLRNRVAFLDGKTLTPFTALAMLVEAVLWSKLLIEVQATADGARAFTVHGKSFPRVHLISFRPAQVGKL